MKFWIITGILLLILAAIVCAVLVLLIAVILLRTLFFRPKKQPPVSEERVEFDQDAAVEALAELIQCKTVSYADPSLEDDEEFDKLISLLPKLYPRIFDVCSCDQLPDRALLLRWPGRREENPCVMMAHYDVVPVMEESWEKPPFAAIIEDGVMWGRGTLDTKVTFNAILSAANHLIGKGFVPENDMYFAFSGGEEINGMGAVNIVNYFVERGIQPALVVDEGGAVVENVFPGVKKPCGLIGIAEKGMINVQYSCHSNGGHASAPKPHTPVGILSKACCKVEKNPFPYHVDGPAGQMFNTLGRHSTFLYRMIFANLWCFGWVLNLLGKKSGGDMNALMRTTVAFTQMEGSSTPNVIPPEAKMVSNIRLNPSDSVASAMGRLRSIIDDDQVELSILQSSEPSPMSEVNCPAWDKVASTVAETWPGCLVSPYLMVQCSDSRHYRDLSNHVYRFSAMDLTTEERKTVHGHNERIRLETIGKAVEFYIRLMKKC